MLYELLSAEARIYAHYQHHVYIINNILQQGYGSCRINCYRRLHPCFADLLHHTVQMRTSLVMHIHDMCPQSLHLRNKLLRLYNHQMHIQRFLRQFCHILQYRESERNIGDKHTVHDVDMYPLSLTFVNHFNVSCQITKIGRENRRGYDWFHNVMF